MSKSPCKFPLPYKLTHTLSSFLSYVPDVVNHKFLQAFSKTLSNIKTKIKSNFNFINDNIMPKHPIRPIDAIRQLFESQQDQLNELSKIILTQEGKIKRLEEKIKEDLIKESEKPSGWFFL